VAHPIHHLQGQLTYFEPHAQPEQQRHSHKSYGRAKLMFLSSPNLDQPFSRAISTAPTAEILGGPLDKRRDWKRIYLACSRYFNLISIGVRSGADILPEMTTFPSQCC
jgi:hypothetical protein